MPVYTSCAFDCTHKELGKKLVKDLNDDGILCFYVGDIPTDQRYEMLGETMAALDRSQIFMPFVCEHFEASRLGPKELAYANYRDKLVMPVILDPDFDGVKPGGSLAGLKMTDLSTSSKYKKKFPEFLETVNAMLLAEKARSGRETDASSTAATAGNGDDSSSTASTTGDQSQSINKSYVFNGRIRCNDLHIHVHVNSQDDDASEMAAEEEDAESETGDNGSSVTAMEDDEDDRASQMQSAMDEDDNEDEDDEDGSEPSD